MNTLTSFDIVFKYLVCFDRDDCVVVVAEETNTKRIRLFLVDDRSGRVFRYTGRQNRWESLRATPAIVFMHLFKDALHQEVKIFHNNGNLSEAAPIDLVLAA